jgi:glutathione synthase
MRVLIVADPIADLNAISDTGLVMLREALARKHDVDWASADDFLWYRHAVSVQAQTVLSCERGSFPRLASGKCNKDLADYESIWVRKDPPFDAMYSTLCSLLSLYEGQIAIVNAPSVLFKFHEKLIVSQAVRSQHLNENDVIPTFMGCAEEYRLPDDFPAGPCVTKPWFGHGGKGVELWSSSDEAIDSAFAPDQMLTLYQPFLEKIRETGDRRVFFLNGEYAGDFVRMPVNGSIIANLVQGGTAHLKTMTKKEKDLTKRVGAFLKESGILVAGADYIDGRLSEINITAPTGFQTLIDLEDSKIAGQYLDMVESLIKKINVTN